MKQFGNEARRFLKRLMLLWVHALTQKFICNVFEGKPKNQKDSCVVEPRPFELPKAYMCNVYHWGRENNGRRDSTKRIIWSMIVIWSLTPKDLPRWCKVFHVKVKMHANAAMLRKGSKNKISSCISKLHGRHFDRLQRYQSDPMPLIL